MSSSHAIPLVESKEQELEVKQSKSKPAPRDSDEVSLTEPLNPTDGIRLISALINFSVSFHKRNWLGFKTQAMYDSTFEAAGKPCAHLISCANKPTTPESLSNWSNKFATLGKNKLFPDNIIDKNETIEVFLEKEKIQAYFNQYIHKKYAPKFLKLLDIAFEISVYGCVTYNMAKAREESDKQKHKEMKVNAPFDIDDVIRKNSDQLLQNICRELFGAKSNTSRLSELTLFLVEISSIITRIQTRLIAAKSAELRIKIKNLAAESESIEKKLELSEARNRIYQEAFSHKNSGAKSELLDPSTLDLDAALTSKTKEELQALVIASCALIKQQQEKIDELQNQKSVAKQESLRLTEELSSLQAAKLRDDRIANEKLKDIQDKLYNLASSNIFNRTIRNFVGSLVLATAAVAFAIFFAPEFLMFIVASAVTAFAIANITNLYAHRRDMMSLVNDRPTVYTNHVPVSQIPISAPSSSSHPARLVAPPALLSSAQPQQSDIKNTPAPGHTASSATINNISSLSSTTSTISLFTTSPTSQTLPVSPPHTGAPLTSSTLSSTSSSSATSTPVTIHQVKK